MRLDVGILGLRFGLWTGMIDSVDAKGERGTGMANVLKMTPSCCVLVVFSVSLLILSLIASFSFLLLSFC